MAALAPALASKLSEARLVECRDHIGRKDFWSYTHGELYVLDPWDDKMRRLAVHGLTAYAVVRNPRNGSLVFAGSARLHLCRERPCGYRYDNRVPPYDAHGRVVRLHGPDDGGAGEPLPLEDMASHDHDAEAGSIALAGPLTAPPLADDGRAGEPLPLEDLAPHLADAGCIAIAGPLTVPPEDEALMPLVFGGLSSAPVEWPPGAEPATEAESRPRSPSHGEWPTGAEPATKAESTHHSAGGDAVLAQVQDVSAVVPIGLDPRKREALLWCLEDECALWRKPFTDVPHYLFLLGPCNTRRGWSCTMVPNRRTLYQSLRLGLCPPTIGRPGACARRPMCWRHPSKLTRSRSPATWSGLTRTWQPAIGISRSRWMPSYRTPTALAEVLGAAMRLSHASGHCWVTCRRSIWSPCRRLVTAIAGSM